MQFPEAGTRQLISGVDAVVAAQLSSFCDSQGTDVSQFRSLSL